MLLLTEVGQGNPDTAEFWTDVQTQSAAERAVSFQVRTQASGGKRRPRRRRRRKASPKS